MKTIEIEKKIRLQPHHIKIIAEQGTLLKETTIQDSYFDTEDYLYTAQNVWLRRREGCFELKVGIKQQNGLIDRYEEITDEKAILKYLKIDTSMLEALSLKNLVPFCTFRTQRTSYQLNGITIDIDNANFGDLHYQVAEVEIVVSDLSKMGEAEKKIADFIEELGIDTAAPVPAKLTYYLYHKRPNHYQALVNSKVIQPIGALCIL